MNHDTKSTGPWYTPLPHERQLTFRAVIVGCLLGGMIACINVYLGLQTGWGTSGALLSAILSFSVFKMIRPHIPFSVLENNISQTVGSASSGVSHAIGVVAVLPALKMLGHPLTVSQMYAWSLCVAFLGIFFAVPLRKQMILVEKLRFPTGTATAETIMTMHHAEAGDNKKTRLLVQMAIFAGIYTIASYFIPFLHEPHIVNLLGLSVIGSMGYSLLISPLLCGAGMIIGIRTGASLLIGSIIGWGFLSHYISAHHWVNGVLYDYKSGVAGWILWPGVTLMVSESITALLISLPRLVKSMRKATDIQLSEQTRDIVPFKLWFSGLLLAALACCLGMKLIFDIPASITVIAIGISWVLSMIAARASGVTDINPLTAVGKVTQLAYGVITPGQVMPNLMCAAVSAAGATSGADMLQDWKTGLLLNASPRAQFYAQFFGVFAGILFAVPVYLLFDHAYVIGSAELPAPSAHAWKAMSELLSQGFSSLPADVLPAMLIAGLIGMLLPILHEVKKIKAYVPSGLAIGIAFIVPPKYSIIMFIGGMIFYLWQRYNPSAMKAYGYSVASGLIVGEGLMGIVVAVLNLFHVPRLF